MGSIFTFPMSDDREPFTSTMQPRAGLPTAVLPAFLHHSFVLKPRGLFWGPGFACAGCWASRGASRWRRVQERGGIRPASPALTRVRLPLCPVGSTPRLGRKGAARGRAPSLRTPVLGQMAVAVLHLTCAGSCGRCGGLRRAAAQTATFAVSRPGGWAPGSEVSAGLAPRSSGRVDPRPLS